MTPSPLERARLLVSIGGSLKSNGNRCSLMSCVSASKRLHVDSGREKREASVTGPKLLLTTYQIRM